MSNSNPNVSLREKALYWEQLLADGLEHERWGQPEEALQQFVKARREMEQFLSNEADASPRSKTFLLSSSTKMTLQKVTLCVQDRIRRLRDPIFNKETSVRPGPCGAIPDDAIECLNGKLADILVHGGEPFPVDVPLPTPLQKTRSGYQTNTRRLQKDEDNTLEQLEDIREDRGGEFKHVGVSGRGDLDSSESLQKSKKKSVLTKAGSVRVLDTMRSLSFLQKRENLPRGHHEEQLATDTPDTLLSCPEVSEGETVVKLELEKIGLKDPSAFVDPFLTITLCDAEGTKMGPAQNTKIAMKTEEDHVVFEEVCYIQKPLEQISPGSNVFIEFRHWKTKESKVSNRCWSMMSLQELKKPGAAFLEIYAKPTDFKARKFTRHSVKPLFMHVHVVHLREQ